MLADSSDAHRNLPGAMTSCSRTLGWRSVLLRSYREPKEAEFVTLPTADHLLVLVRRGSCAIESFSGGRWRSAAYRVGDLGMAAPGEPSRLRWRGPRNHDTLQLHLPAKIVDEVADEARARRGAPAGLSHQLCTRDPVVSATLRSLESALNEGASDVYAEAAAYYLATHLVHRARAPQPQPREHTRQLDRVDGYMRSRLAESVSLSELAASIDLSPVDQDVSLAMGRDAACPPDAAADGESQRAAGDDERQRHHRRDRQRIREPLALCDRIPASRRHDAF